MSPSDDEHAATLAAIKELAVTLAIVGADVKAIRDRLDVHDRTQTDFEGRLRTIECVGCPLGVQAREATVNVRTDYEARLRSLERWRWGIPSVAAVVGIGSLIIAIWNAH